MFKTETHLHTKESSPCGRLSAAQMVRLYHEAGYHTIFVSDHFSRRHLAPMGDIPWDEKIDRFLLGYRAACEAAEGLDIVVLLSCEIELPYHKNHYLLYGEVESFLRSHPDIHEASLEDFYRATREDNIFVVQAHAYRDGECYPTPDYIDAIEIYNSNPRHEDLPIRTKRLVAERGLLVTAGSDAHRTEDVLRSGIMTERPIETSRDYIDAVKNGRGEVIKNGGKIYLVSDPHGDVSSPGIQDYLEVATDEDLLIILGDLFFGFGEGGADFTEWIIKQNKNIAFIDGNHDNYDLIWSYPEETWHGGRVNRISEHVVYLRRGEIYDLFGRSVFVMGGCISSQKWHEAGLASPKENPSEEEISRAIANLASRDNKVDYILTHKYESGIDGNISGTLARLVGYIEENVQYRRWYYGHWHGEASPDPKHYQIYHSLREAR